MNRALVFDFYELSGKGGGEKHGEKKEKREEQGEEEEEEEEEDDDDDEIAFITDQYMFGDVFMVAPIIEDTKERKVYLPGPTRYVRFRFPSIFTTFTLFLSFSLSLFLSFSLSFFLSFSLSLSLCLSLCIVLFLSRYLSANKYNK